MLRANDSAEARLRELNLVLPVPARPAANYVTAVQAAGLVFLSGQGPISDGQVRFSGKVGLDLSEEDAYQAARLTAINLLTNLRQELGSLDRVTRVVKLMAWVNSAPGFQRQHVVVDGASDLIMAVFGERGRHARSAVSSNELPFGIAVEIEMIVACSAQETVSNA